MCSFSVVTLFGLDVSVAAALIVPVPSRAAIPNDSAVPTSVGLDPSLMDVSLITRVTSYAADAAVPTLGM